MTLELKLPPPLVGAITAALIWSGDYLWPSGTVQTSALNWLKYGLMFTALMLGCAALAHFWRANTTVHPHTPQKSRVLVAHGVYRFSRNPMYLSLLLLLTAWSVQVGSLLSPLWLAVFVWYITRFQILPEERILQELFGEEFIAYRRRVRRWI